ncbi:uncharacterized protein [Clytia hemisphaerica]|uniref:WAP domain-containing protein n=1 Tax=Clytia hemisphaerica TaxID=252671 RepID=A0A7M5X1Y5_9CNID
MYNLTKDMISIFIVLIVAPCLVYAGYMSRIGVCPHPTTNFVLKDTRLNFYGLSYILPGDESPPCTMSECQLDTDCHGDHKCCSNHCGAYVCTESMREPRPCQYFTCPITKTCKIQKVQCVEPSCPEMLTIARPMCVNGGPYWEMTKRKRSRILRPDIFTQEVPFISTNNAGSSRDINEERENSWLLALTPFWNGEKDWKSSTGSTSSWLDYYGRRKRATKS